MKYILSHLFVVVIIVFTVNSTYAQGSFYSTSSSKKIIEGSSFKYSIVADNIEVRGIKDPNFGGLILLSGPMQSTSASNYNGAISRKQERVFTLTASKPGIYTITKASGIVNNKRVYTKPIRIEVLENKQADNNSSTPNFMVKMLASDTVAYIGQQITINYVIYKRLNIYRKSFIQESDFSGFFAVQNKRFSRNNSIEEINGVQYYTGIIHQVSIYPQQTGTYEISRSIIDITYRNKNYQYQRERIATDNLKIVVKDVPKPIPANYLGGVGLFKIQAKLDRSQVQNHKAFNLIVVYEGDGDPKMFNPPALDLGENFEVYDPVLQKELEQENSDRIVFSKKYQYTVVPQKEGRYNIKAEASYFMPDSARYINLSQGPFPIQILEGRVVEKIVDHTVNNTLKPNWSGSQLKESNNYYSQNGLNVFMILAFCSILGMIGTKIYQDQTSEDRAEKKRQIELHNRVIKKLSEAKIFLEANKTRAFYDEIFKATQKYLSDKFGMDKGNITAIKVQKSLESQAINQSIIDDINSLLEDSQLAIFGGMSKRTMQETYDILSNVIKVIETKE